MPSLPPPSSCEELLAQMISFETVNLHYGGSAGGEARLAAHLEQLAAQWGLSSRRDPVDGDAFNLLISSEVAPSAEWLLFESHLDTVGVEGMTVPPFRLTPKGDRLHGRGACDTKGSGAAMFWALRDFSCDPRRTRNAGVLFAIDEEARMSGAQAFAGGGLREFLPRLRGLIVGEPTGLRPVVAHNGSLRWKTITRGISAHSADPSKGRSAIGAMLAVIAALEEKFIPLANRVFPLTGRAAASINVIHGGSAVNIIPDYCEISCDRRLVPGESPDTVLAQRDAALAGLAVEHDSLYLAPPLPPGSSAALLAWLQPAFTAASLDPTATGVPYATDASHYAAAGAPVLVLGPGDIAQAHTHDEWLSRAELNRTVELYSKILRLTP